MNVIGILDDSVIGKKFLSTYGFVLGGVAITYMVSFIVSFDGTIDYVVITCVDLTIRYFMPSYEVYILNYK